MEVPLPWRDADHVAGLEHVTGLAPAPNPAASCQRVQELPARVLMPMRPRPRREVHDPNVGAVVGGKRSAERHFAGEPARIAVLVGRVGRSCDLHATKRTGLRVYPPATGFCVFPPTNMGPTPSTPPPT